MKRIFLVMMLAMALPVFAAAEDWNNVSIVDTQCATKVEGRSRFTYARSCALTCAKSGFGIRRQRRKLPQIRCQWKR